VHPAPLLEAAGVLCQAQEAAPVALLGGGDPALQLLATDDGLGARLDGA